MSATVLREHRHTVLLDALSYRAKMDGVAFYRKVSQLERDIRYEYGRPSVLATLKELEADGRISMRVDRQGLWITVTGGAQ